MERKRDIYFERWSWLPEEVRRRAHEERDRLTGIRLHAGGPAQLVYYDGDELLGNMGRSEFAQMVSAMMGHSLYARQKELARGYFTLDDGSRAGVCGDFSNGGPHMLTDIGSVNIRIAREVKGCADGLMDMVKSHRGTAVISPPGMGKTTLIRDIARQLSEGGQCVCIIDERDEIAACRNGVPNFDLGPRTDVISGIVKHEAILMAIRSCAPDVLVADEVGSEEDAAAIADALRCGVKVVVSAHGDSLEKSKLRPVVGDMLGNFDAAVLLGPETGAVRQIRIFGGSDNDV